MSGEIDVKKNYKELLEKYKHRQDSNEFLKVQLQDMSTKLKQEQRDKEKLREEVTRVRTELIGRHSPIPIASNNDSGSNGSPTPSPSASPSAFQRDREVIIDGLQQQLKGAYNRLDEEMILHEETKHNLEYYKQMLSVEGKTRLFIEERNSALEAELKELRAQSASDMLAMSKKLAEASQKLEDETSARMILEKSKESLESEIEELTKSLFEEANSMVSTEARQRHELAVAKKKLEQELEDTKRKLEMDEQLLKSLQERFDQVEKERVRARTHHRNSHSTSSVALVAASLRGVNSHPNLTSMDGKSLPGTPPVVVHTPTGSPKEEFLTWKKRSKSLSEVGSSPVDIIDSKRHSLHGEDTVSGSPASQAEEGVGDWELLGDSQDDDDSLLSVQVEGQINLKTGLSQFIAFVQSAKQEWTGSRLMDRVLREDVGPCLRLRMQEDKAYRKLLEAVWNNKIFLEPFTSPQTSPCSGCDAEGPCKWRLRFHADMEWKVIDDICRERIIRACDFYSYLRNIRKGLVKKNLVAMYKEFLRLRLMMNLARVCTG